MSCKKISANFWSSCESDVNDRCSSANINEYARFDDLRATVNMALAKAYFERTEGGPVPPFKVKIRADKVLKDFLIRGVLSLSLPDEAGPSGMEAGPA